LLRQCPRFHGVAKNALIALHGKLNKIAQAIACFLLPGDPSMLLNGLNMAVSLCIGVLNKSVFSAFKLVIWHHLGFTFCTYNTSCHTNITRTVAIKSKNLITKSRTGMITTMGYGNVVMLRSGLTEEAIATGTRRIREPRPTAAVF